MVAYGNFQVGHTSENGVPYGLNRISGRLNKTWQHTAPPARATISAKKQSKKKMDKTQPKFLQMLA